MPLYDYQCKQCRQITEVRHGFKDVHTEACAKCGGTMMRVFNAAGIVFKGSGFYITDSRKGSGDGAAPATPAAPAGTPSAPAASTSATESKPTESKATESKPTESKPTESKKSDAA